MGVKVQKIPGMEGKVIPGIEILLQPPVKAVVALPPAHPSQGLSKLCLDLSPFFWSQGTPSKQVSPNHKPS